MPPLRQGPGVEQAAANASSRPDRDRPGTTAGTTPVGAPTSGPPGLTGLNRPNAPVALDPAGEPRTVGAAAGDAQEAAAPDTSGQSTAERADGLTPEEAALVEQLKARDAEVRRHEQAHAAVGGPYAGFPVYEYQRGPDGNQYAVGGSVSIDVAPVPNDPAATIQKMDVVIRAALAPAEPSSQDRSVARQAEQTAQAARVELQQQAAAERRESLEAAASTDDAGDTEAQATGLEQQATAAYRQAAAFAEIPESHLRLAA